MMENVKPKLPECSVAPLRAWLQAQAEISASKRKMLLDVLAELQDGPDMAEVVGAWGDLQGGLDEFSDIEKGQPRAFLKIDKRLWASLDGFAAQDRSEAEGDAGSALDI